MIFYKIIPLSILSLLVSKSAFAYLDPGSGSLLVYFLIGALATLTYSIKSLIFKTKAYLRKYMYGEKVDLKKKRNIVFYSEGGHYWSTFKPVIEELLNEGVECSYYSSDKNDEGLKYNSPKLETMFIGNSQYSQMSLNYLKAKIFVMTTPQLDILHLKKSKDVDYFVHLIHSPVDVFKYRPFSFDFFDCIMCSGYYQINHLRMIEKERNLKSKNLLETGLVYFDELLKTKQDTNSLNDERNDQKIILVAPTWGRSSLLNKVGFNFIKILIDAGLEVILRPHPQSYISDLELIKDIEVKCDNFDQVSIDNNPSAQKSMEKAHLMVSDVSGVIFDFAFIYEKPVVTFKSIVAEDSLLEINTLNKDKVDKIKIWEIENKSKISTEISVDDINDLPEIIEKTLQKDFQSSIQKLRSESVFNYGYAGKVASSQLQKILEDL